MSFVISNKRQCYQHTQTNGQSIKDAAELCHKKGDKLPITQSQEEHNLFANFILKEYKLKMKIPRKLSLPIDLQLNDFDTYVMSNGKEPTWTKWFQGQPDGNGKQKFVKISDKWDWQNSNWGTWLDLSPAEPAFDIVCQQVCSSGTVTSSVLLILFIPRRKTL